MARFKRIQQSNQEEHNTKKMIRKHIVLMGILLFIGICIFTGASYALFSVLVEGKQSISITTKTLKVELKDGEYIREDPRGTMTDKQGKKTEPYRFTITNTGTMPAYYSLYLINEGPIEGKELMDTNYLKYELKGDDGSQQEGRIGSLKKFYYSKEIQPGEENKVTYELRLWLDKDTPNSEQEKSYQSKVAVEANQFLQPVAPVLADNMIPVVYDEIDKRWEKADVTKAWYNYDQQKWANAVTVTNDTREKYQGDIPDEEVKMDDILQMWVWIPRYSYTIQGTYGKGGKDASNPGEIDVKFIDTNVKETGTATYEGENPSGWYTPPGFTFGEEELPGIWVGKFETGYSSGEGTGVGAVSTDAAQSDTEEPNRAIIKPNVYSWNGIRVSTLDLVSRRMTASDNVFGFDQSTYDSHAIKNTEWALISYLTQSKYGKYGNSLYSGVNKEVYINNYSGYMTGCSSGLPSAVSSSSCGNTYDVMIDQGGGKGYAGAGASSTGNITGIYDINGGAWEYAMAVLNKMSGNTQENNSGYEGSLADGSSIEGRAWPDAKYYDFYTSDDVNTACGGKACKGHALNETAGWYDDLHGMLRMTAPWSNRSGYYNNAAYAGNFYYGYGSGVAGSNYSFRQVLVPVEKV